MVTPRTIVTSGYVMTEGDEIYYEVRGQGQPLLMISGGGGDAGFYSLVGDILSDEYKVITYDRRGNSRSTRNNPQNVEVSQQSRDAVAVLQAAGETSAFIFGNSGGAIIALEMAKSQPQAVKAAVVHEPPVLRVLPDSYRWRRLFASIYRLIFTFGYKLAMLRFAMALGIPGRTLSKVPKELTNRMGNNQEFLLNYEMLPFTNYVPDVAIIKTNRVKIFMAVGEWTLDRKKFYGRTAPILAKLLDCELVYFPGNHMSYIDLPVEWAAALRDVLHKTA